MNKKVLIVDDSAYMRSLINMALTDAGFTVVGEAHDGETALMMGMSLNPDLITLDNILPDMLGTDILRILKEDEKIPAKVIMISAVGQDNVIQEGMSLGASDYLTKPFSPEKLIEVVTRVMS